MSNPLQSFLSGQESAIAIQQNKLALDEARQSAPQRAAMRDITLERQKQVSQGFDQERALKGAQLMDKTVDYMLKTTQDPVQRFRMFNSPQMQKIRQSYDIQLPENLTAENFSNEGLMAFKTGLGQSMQQMTSGQINLESQAEALAGSINPDTNEPFTVDTARQALIRKQSGIDRRAGTVTGAEAIATTPGVTDAVAASKREIKSEEERGAGEARTVTKIIDESFDKIGGIRKNIRNIDRAITALNKGAGAGKIEKLLPSVKAASIELDNIRGELGLDVVGATTFGALSESELQFALDVALPPLDDPDLKDFLTRKREAQTKLIDYLDNQIDFLEGGGTVGEWRSLVSEADKAIDAGADPAAVQARLKQMSRGE